MAKKILLQETIVKKKADKPIHFVPDGKSFTDVDKMKKTLNPTEIEDEKGLIKTLNKGDHVYCYVCPYDSEMSAGEKVQHIKIYWSTDREKAMDDYYSSRENI